MPKTIHLQSQDHLKVANTLRVLLRQAEAGEIDGLIYVASRVYAVDKLGISGLFADDMELATEAAREGFNCILGHKACIERQNPKLPRRLRKESANEQICSVVSCSSRRAA